ncbi:MAG TPA: tyrosine recombinase [Bacilli bacterium]|nr:tyrosine recombinase [Bacilli bacterium]
METEIDKYIEYLRVEKSYSNYTESNYLIDLDNYSDYLKNNKINYLNITYKEIVEYEKYLKEVCNLESSSINRHLSSLRSFYNYLELHSLIKSNPFKLVNGPKRPERLPNYMKYSEFEEMVNSCDETPLGIRNRALLETLLATGARISEIINLDVDDLDLNNGEVKVLGKGNKERICYLNNHAISSLNEYIESSRGELLNNHQSNRLFINHIGGDLTTRGVRTILDNIIQKSCMSIKVTPHTFRHTFATMLLNEGADLKTVQELLGHANISTTAIYTHITTDYIKDIYLHSHPRSKQ